MVLNESPIFLFWKNAKDIFTMNRYEPFLADQNASGHGSIAEIDEEVG